MPENIASAFRLMPDYLAQHVLLSASALTLGVLISMPLALLAVRHPRLRWPLLATASLVQTIPGLALLALFYPLLLLLSAMTRSLWGIGIPALGFLPSLLALTLYSILPMVRNAVTGLTGIDSSVLEAADGVGMTPRQRLVRVEIPLAMPVIMAGVRTAAVWTIGAATLSTSVGQTSLGNYIFAGLQTENWVYVLFGCLAATGLALLVDQLLGLVETGAVRRDRWRVAMGGSGLLLGVGIALAPLFWAKPAAYVVGGKNFSEQYILAELIAGRLELEGVTVERKQNLGSAIAFRALANSEIDTYVDYSGTLWTNVMGRRDSPPREEMLREITLWMRGHHGVIVLGALGFENAYVLAMRSDRAASLGIRTLGDLARHAPRLSLGSDLEFLSRPEWTALHEAYGLEFRERRSFNPTFMYRALEDGSVDVISAFSSDGRIAALKLAALTDPKSVSPGYDAVVLLSPKRSGDAILRRVLAPLLGRISVERMREANLMVDRDIDKAAPALAAGFLLEGLGVSNP